MQGTKFCLRLEHSDAVFVPLYTTRGQETRDFVHDVTPLLLYDFTTDDQRVCGEQARRVSQRALQPHAQTLGRRAVLLRTDANLLVGSVC